MTLTEALHVLHRAGKIRTPWLPGSTWTDGVAIGFLCLGEWSDPAGGLLLPNVDGWEKQLWSIPAACERLELVLTAPGSVGVLSALAREATGELTLIVESVLDGDTIRWFPATAREEGHMRCASEGEVWAAVLIAAAESCTAEVGT